MHLARGLTTTSTRKRKTNITKSQQEELERGWRDRNVRLKEMHLPKETFEQYLEWVYGKGTKTKTEKKYKTTHSSSVAKARPLRGDFQEPIPGIDITLVTLGNSKKASAESNEKDGLYVSKTRPWVTGACAAKPSPTYTGTNVIGIATMHKSNMVPIFSSDEAKDVARMRR
jgi:hypothetical protein